MTLDICRRNGIEPVLKWAATRAGFAAIAARASTTASNAGSYASSVVASSTSAAFYHPSTTFDFPRCFEVATIVCHSNCRADKTDLCLPDWVYEKLKSAGIRLVS